MINLTTYVIFFKRIEKWVIIDEAENGKGESIIKVVIIDTSCESSWHKIYPMYLSIDHNRRFIKNIHSFD